MEYPIAVKIPPMPRNPLYGGAYRAEAERPARSRTNIRFFNTPMTQQQQIIDEEQGNGETYSTEQSGRSETREFIGPVELSRVQILSTLADLGENGRDVVHLITQDGISNQDRAAILPNQQWM